MAALTDLKIFDCDIHQTFANQKELYPYLSENALKRVKASGLGYPRSPYHTQLSYKRKDASPGPGVTAGSDKAFLKKQLFDELGVKGGILNGSGVIATSYMPEIEFPLQLVRAYNQWMINEWIDMEDCFYGSLHIALQDPEGSAQMIREFGAHPKIVQVIIPAMTPLPIGHVAYQPILRAIEDTGLILAFHIWQPFITTQTSTPIGNPSTYLEWKTLSGLPLMSQLVHMILSGVFVEYPNLKCVYLEGGYSWMVYFKHRMEQLYKSFRSEVSWLKESPNYYLHKHCRFGTQPLEELESDATREILTSFGAEDLLVFTSDYPHWDADNPIQAPRLLKGMDLEKIMGKNALDFYGIDLV